MFCFVIDIVIYINVEDLNFLKLFNFYYLLIGRKKFYLNGFFFCCILIYECMLVRFFVLIVY